MSVSVEIVIQDSLPPSLPLFSLFRLMSYFFPHLQVSLCRSRFHNFINKRIPLDLTENSYINLSSNSVFIFLALSLCSPIQAFATTSIINYCNSYQLEDDIWEQAFDTARSKKQKSECLMVIKAGNASLRLFTFFLYGSHYSSRGLCTEYLGVIVKRLVFTI